MREARMHGQDVTDPASSALTPVMVGRPPDHYLAGWTLGRSTLRRYLGGLLLILMAWAVGTIAVQAALLAAGRAHPTSPAGQLAFLTSTFALGCLAATATDCRAREAVTCPRGGVGVTRWCQSRRD